MISSRVSIIVGLSCLISALVFMNISNNSLGSEQEISEIPDAKSVYDTETMQLPNSVGYYVVLIANEAHEDWSEEKHKLLTDHNPYFVPTHLVLPKGTAIIFLNADAPWNTPHPHTINLEDTSGKVVYSTGSMEYSDASDSKILPPGNYSITDSKYDWMKGSITVTEENSIGNQTVGGFYSPTHEVSNKLDNDGMEHPGWMGYYETEFSKKGFNILSKHEFNYNTCSYCEGKFWPDNKTGEHTLFIFSTYQSPMDAIVKLQKLVKDNAYI
jgi:hypothetical protein